MKELQLTESAKEIIHRVIEQSGRANAVVVLYERAGTKGLFDDVAREMIKGVGGDMADLAKSRFIYVRGELEYSLAVGADERGAYSSEHLKEIDGITFVMPFEIANALCGFFLDFDHGKFFLRDENGRTHLLSQVLSEIS